MAHPAYGEKLGTAFRKLDHIDAIICAMFNRLSRNSSTRTLFRIVSRLGDGVFWYALMAALPAVGGRQGLTAALHMLLCSAVGLMIYKLTKQRLVRERPFIDYADKVACTLAPLDRYSFPSGHTLHAVSFTLIACHYFPLLGLFLVPFTVLVALSRMVLGLHYPSDVLAGAGIGGAIALASFDVVTRLV